MTLESEGVTKSDGWSSSSLAGSEKGITSVYSSTLGKYVRFQPVTMKAGWYEVAFWYINNQQNPVKMTANVHTAGGILP